MKRIIIPGFPISPRSLRNLINWDKPAGGLLGFRPNPLLVKLQNDFKQYLYNPFQFSLKIWWLIIIYILFITTLFAKIQTQPGVKPGVATEKKTKCCSIQRTFKNKINITEICVENGITKIELQVIIPYTMCSNLTDVGLTDETGKSYKIVGMKNIPSCPEILQVNPGHKFYWNFEKLDPGISSLDLTENKNSNLAPTFPNWEFWYWKDISVGHCKF